MLKQTPSIFCIQETHYHQGLILSWGKMFEKIFQANWSKTQAGVAIIISNKINFKPKLIKSDG